MKIFVSSDSTCDLTPEVIKEYGVSISPLYIQRGDESLRDGVEITPADIFAYTDRTGKLCGTAAVPIADYLDYFRKALRDADQIVHFTISSEMSACYQNAVAAGKDFPGKVFVVDSRNLSTGIGHLVLDAVLLAREGKTGAEIKAILDERKEKLNVSFVLDTLEYLRKGGRCSSVAALGANLLKLKPCIEVKNGTMGVGKKYRGNLEKCLEAYVRERIEGHDDVDYRRIFITDSGVSDEEIERIAAMLRSFGPFEEIIHTRAGSTISSHCGPRCFGILYYNK